MESKGRSANRNKGMEMEVEIITRNVARLKEFNLFKSGSTRCLPLQYSEEKVPGSSCIVVKTASKSGKYGVKKE